MLAAVAQLISVGTDMLVCHLLQSIPPIKDKGRCRQLHSIMKQATEEEKPSSKGKLTLPPKKDPIKCTTETKT